MTGQLSYVAFLSVAVALPAVALAAVAARRADRPRRAAAGVAVLVCIAVSYTAPWDSHLIGKGVWDYGAGVVAFRIGRIPLGEWLFFALQTALTGCAFYALAPSVAPTWPHAPADPSAGGRSPRLFGAAVWMAVAGVGGVLALGSPTTYYLGMILAWGAPVVAFLWAVGGPVLRRHRRLVAVAVALPSAYLWAVDRVAIGADLWRISPTYTVGVSVFGLPIEEAVFFALTNALVVQGLLLFDWVMARADERGPAHAVRGLVPAVTRVTGRWR